MVIEVEVFRPEDNAQAKYIVRGIDDVLWTDSIETVVAYIKEDLERLEREGT